MPQIHNEANENRSYIIKSSVQLKRSSISKLNSLDKSTECIDS